MQIHELVALGRTPTTGDSLAIDTGSATVKIDYAALATAILDKIGAGSDGVVDIPHGGSGLSASPSLLINLAATAAADVMQANPRPGVTGILGLANGGLGVDFSAASGAGFHNAIPRGKNLGTLTGTMSDCIRAGDFKGLAIGDTFKYGSRTHTIAHFDPDIACGDNINLGHHIAVISDGGWSSKWNETNNTVTGGVNGGAGYVDSTIRAYIKSSGGPQDQIIGDFGSGHVLSYRALYPSTYDASGKATGWAWVDARSELLNETQVYGHQVWGQNGYEDGIDKFQLAIFRLMPAFTNIRATWWLRSVNSATYAALVLYNGSANNSGASNSIGVRPLSLIA